MTDLQRVIKIEKKDKYSSEELLESFIRNLRDIPKEVAILYITKQINISRPDSVPIAKSDGIIDLAPVKVGNLYIYKKDDD